MQKASLAGLGAELIDERGASQAATLIAMGALVDQLDAREATARAAFADRFAPLRRRARCRSALPSPVRPDHGHRGRGMMRG